MSIIKTGASLVLQHVPDTLQGAYQQREQGNNRLQHGRVATRYLRREDEFREYNVDCTTGKPAGRVPGDDHAAGRLLDTQEALGQDVRVIGLAEPMEMVLEMKIEVLN